LQVSIHSTLRRAGIDVITDISLAIFHQKFLVRDDGANGAPCSPAQPTSR
jgi:hypothetical protein